MNIKLWKSETCLPAKKDNPFGEKEAKLLFYNIQRLIRKRQTQKIQLALQIGNYVREGKVVKLRKITRKFIIVVQELRLLKKLLSQQEKVQIPHLFIFSSWLLKDSFRHCTKTDDEGMHFLAGIEVDGIAVATKLLTFPYAFQSVAGAAGNHLATVLLTKSLHEKSILMVD